MAVRFLRAAGAVRIVKRAARPGLDRVGDRIASDLPGNVPVVHGGAVSTYNPIARRAGESVHVHVGSPLWHLLEYGTAYSAAYRPVERTVRGLGLRWEPN